MKCIRWNPKTGCWDAEFALLGKGCQHAPSTNDAAALKGFLVGTSKGAALSDPSSFGFESHVPQEAKESIIVLMTWSSPRSLREFRLCESSMEGQNGGPTFIVLQTFQWV